MPGFSEGPCTVDLTLGHQRPTSRLQRQQPLLTRCHQELVLFVPRVLSQQWGKGPAATAQEAGSTADGVLPKSKDSQGCRRVDHRGSRLRKEDKTKPTRPNAFVVTLGQVTLLHPEQVSQDPAEQEAPGQAHHESSRTHSRSPRPGQQEWLLGAPVLHRLRTCPARVSLCTRPRKCADSHPSPRATALLRRQVHCQI